MEALGGREWVGGTQSAMAAALAMLVGPDQEKVGLNAQATAMEAPLRIPVMPQGQVVGSGRLFPRMIGMTNSQL